MPRPAFAIAICVWLAFFLLMMLVPFRLDPEAQKLAAAGQAGHLHPTGNSAVCAGAAGRLRVRRCETARHALRDVDPVGRPHPQCHRDHPVLRFARSAAGKLYALRRAGAAWIRLLSQVRWTVDRRLSAMPADRGAGLEPLRALRGAAAGGIVGRLTRLRQLPARRRPTLETRPGPKACGSNGRCPVRSCGRDLYERPTK